MGKNGGARPGAGRKRKSSEQELIQHLAPLDAVAHDAFKKALKKGASWAVKLFYNYRFGMPVQRQIVAETDIDSVIFDIEHEDLDSELAKTIEPTMEDQPSL